MSRTFFRFVLPLCSFCLCGSLLHAEPPVASYIFPAGGRRGTAVDVRVGGLFLNKRCNFEMLGPGVRVPPQLERTKTVWFEGPLVPLPDSQQAEDYPKDMAGRVEIAADATLGERFWRVWTAQGAAPAMRFVVGDLPEVVEEEIDGSPVPVEVRLPVTINGRIFPREDVDVWAFDAKQGQTITAEVCAARLGSPLDSRLEVLDPQGHTIAENDDTFGADSFVRFTAGADGKYRVKIHDINFRGGQACVYRLTLTADAYVDRAYPLGGRRGTKTRFALTGQGLPKEPVEIALPSDGPPVYEHRLPIDGKLTNPFRLDLDDLPEYPESEPNDEPAAVKPLALPAMANGRIDRPGDVDYWAVTVHKGELCEFELRAARLGSPLNGVLAVCDAVGKELTRAAWDGVNEPLIRFTAPADGTYLLRVTDQFRSRGGLDFAYRLRLDHPPAPDFHLRLAADVLTAPRGAPARLKVLAERLGGFAEPITLTVEGLPPGVTMTPTTIPANQPAAEVPLKLESAAAIKGSRLTVRGSGKVGERSLTRTATLPSPRGGPEVDSVLLAVVLPTPFKIVSDYDVRWAPRGTVHHRHYRIERNGFDGPLEISLADRQMRHLQGVTGPTITVPSGVSEFDYAVQLPPWMETGRTSRSCVVAVGVVKDADGTTHELSFSSVQQNEQIVAVVEPGRVGIETDRASLMAEPGKAVSVPVRIKRGKGLTGAVRLELVLPAHIRGISATPVDVAADKSAADLAIRFGADAPGPFNMPVVIRATIMDRGEPIVAETPLEILAKR
jgi:hypothetical protein